MRHKNIIDEQLSMVKSTEFSDSFSSNTESETQDFINEINCLPQNLDASGLYVYQTGRNREELRLDVDGRYPQMEASGVINSGLRNRIHWVARLKPQGTDKMIGNIWYKDGNTASFPYVSVRISINRSADEQKRTVKVAFLGINSHSSSRLYRFESRYFHPVELEFDRVSDVASDDAVTEINTCAHPNRPTRLECERLSINTVFQRAGFDVTTSGGNGTIPIDEAGTNSTWSNAEMHDAMQSYWSRFANKPQWATWVLFANLHDSGKGLGGIMFDDIGPNHRQGTALFENSFVSDAPIGDINSEAWVSRMRFWTAVHEMGHSFNLAHSWQKALGTSWTPIQNEAEARSFMNYPFFVNGGATAFFADFENRFSDSELLFMRHAPSRFVQMGNADWFDNHAFEQANVLEKNLFNLQLKINRSVSKYEFLEPIILEMKLSNISSGPLLVDENILTAAHNITVIIKQKGKPAREWHPFVRYLRNISQQVLYPGESVFESLSVSMGINGWDIAEPGQYTVQMLLTVDGGDIISNPVSLQVLPVSSYDAQCCAQDIFSEDVGRILALNGSRELSRGNDILNDLIERLPDSQIARHARIALAIPLVRDYKTLAEKNGSVVINTITANLDEAEKVLNTVLLNDSDSTANTVGHIEFKKIVDSCTSAFAQHGHESKAKNYSEQSYKTLLSRGVPEWVFGKSSVIKKMSEAKKNKNNSKSDVPA